MSTPTFQFKRGDTLGQVFSYEESAGVPMPLTGATARMHWRDPKGELVMEASTDDGRIVLEPTIDGSPAIGEAHMRVEADVTELLPLRDLTADLELTLSGGTVVSTETMVYQVVKDETYV